MQQVVRTIERIAPSEAIVLVTGESGTGKEVIADLVHALSSRSKNKIIKVNCAALPRELIESELFGHKKDSFTGARTDRIGLFRRPRAARSFSTKFPRCRLIRRASSSACCRTRKSGPSATPPVTRPTAASSPPPTGSPRTPSRTASSAKTCFSASARSPSTCRHCANAATTSCRWPIHF